MIACVLAVALGAALFVLPYIVEYFAREQENASVSDQRSAILASHVKELEARSTVMADQITRLSQAQEAAPKEQPPAAFDTAALKALEDRLDQQAKQLKTAEQRLEKLRMAQKSAQPEPEKETVPESEAKPAPGKKAEPAVKPVSKPKAEPRPRKQAEPQLLKRAIHEKQDQAAQAVDRIIESKLTADKKETPKAEPEEKQPESLPKPKTEPVPEAKVEPAPAPAAEPKTETPKPAPEPEAAKSPARVASKPKALVLPKSAPEVKATPEPTPKPVAPEKASAPAPLESKLEAKPEPKQDAEAKPELKPAADTDVKPASKAKPEAAPSLFGAGEVPASPTKTRAKKNETACIVNSLIGIGNKPYVRGSGGGLNWDSGLVMEFEAIGKWRWTAPADLDGPIEVQVYRNDEDPDTSGKHTLKPGEALVIDAKFQG